VSDELGDAVGKALLVAHNIGEGEARKKAGKLVIDIGRRYESITGYPASPGALARFAMRAVLRCYELDATARGVESDWADRLLEMALESDTVQNRELVWGIASDAMALARRSWPDKRGVSAQVASLLLLLVLEAAEEEAVAS